jgi:LPPG:FO 2-phospho-L-lactate transferase
VAVSPIVGGAAIKGPTAKMMRELNIPQTAARVSEHYGDLIDGFILDQVDGDLHGALEVPTIVAQSVMVTLEDRIELARTTLEFLRSLSV